MITGYVVPNLDLSPMCHPQFKPGPPSESAQVASYFIYEVIQNSQIIDLEKLCINPGKLVWAIYIDLICLNYDGNILDEFILPTEDECKSECLIVPNCAYYVYDNANGGCECRDSKATQECDLIRGPQKPSLSADC